MKYSFPQNKNQFLENFNIKIDPFLSDCTLTVNRLTRLIGMSRTDLHRKLSKETGMSTTKYIRYLRIKKAAQLMLKNPNWSIYQIALEVGFKNQSYFSTRFKEIYTVCPKEFRTKTSQLEHTIKSLEHTIKSLEHNYNFYTTSTAKFVSKDIDQFFIKYLLKKM